MAFVPATLKASDKTRVTSWGASSASGRWGSGTDGCCVHEQVVFQHALKKSLDAAAIFQMVLSKPEYVPAEERLPAAEPPGSPPGKSQKRPCKAAASPPKGFLGGLMRSGAFDDLDVATLKELENQRPPSAFKSTTKSNAKSKSV